MITISPNPTSSYLNYLFSEENKYPFKYKILTAVGNCVGHGQIESAFGTINIENFENGIYFIEFDDNENKLLERKKCIILK